MTERSDPIMPIEQRLDLQDERLNKHDERLNQQDERIIQLEKYDKDKHERLKKVEENYEKLENTIVSENKEMRLFFLSNMDKQWDLIKSRDAQRHDTKKMNHELKKTKIERWSEIVYKLALPGSILYLLFENYMR